MFGHVQTAWFRIKNQDAQLLKQDAVDGKIADVSITGAIIAGGRVDVSVEVIDGNGNIATLIAKGSIRSSGVQAASTKVRGILKRIPARGCVPTVAP